MLGQVGVHYTTLCSQELIVILHISVPVSLCYLEYLAQSVGHGLVRSKDTEVLALCIELEYVSYETAQLDHVLCLCSTGSRNVDTVISEIGQSQVSHEQTAVCMGVSTHSSLTCRSQLFQLGDESAVLVEQLLGMIALQPIFQLLQVLRL